MDFLNKLVEQLKKAAQELIDANKDKIPTKPSEPAKPSEPVVSGSYIQSDKILGLMLTDLLCDPQLENRRDDLLKFRVKYNTILSLVDLQKNGTKQTRPYVNWARTRTELTALGEKNIKFLHSLGFKVHVILLNAWGAKNGFTSQMGSTQESLPNEAALYTDKQLDRERSFIQDLLSKVGDKIDGLMPLLEATQKGAATFGMKMAESIRAQGFKGKIVFNHISDARSELNKHNYKSYGVLIASSINTANAWRSSSNDIKNTDGMQELTENRTDLIDELTKSGGPFGFYLWSTNLIGSKNGRSSYSDNWVKFANSHVYANNSSTNNPTSPSPAPSRPEPTNETPPQRHKRLYPNIPLTGGDNTVGNRNTLWKPVADGNKGLVVVASFDLPKTNYVSIEKNGAVLEKKALSTVYSAANGCRLNWRFSKKGAQFGTGLTLRVSTVEGDYTASIPDGGKRYDPVALKKVSNIPVTQEPKPVPKPDPKPDPKPNDPVVPINKWFRCSANSIWFHPKLQATIERAVMCYNLPNNLYENAKYIGNNTWQFSKLFSQYKRGSMDSVIGVKCKNMVPELKDVWRGSNSTYQINPYKNDWDYPHVTPHDPVPPPNGGGEVVDPNPDPKPQDPTPVGNWPHGNAWIYQYADGRLDVNPKLLPWLNTAKNRAVMFVYNVNAWVYPGGFSFDRANKIGDYTFKVPKQLNQYPRGNVNGKGWLSWRLELDPSKTAEYHRSYASLGLPKFKSPQNDNGTRSVDPNFTGPISLEVK